MREEALEIWDKVLNMLKMFNDIDESKFSSWIKPIKPISYQNKTLIVEVDNSYAKGQVDEFKDKIIGVLNALKGEENLKFEIVIKKKKDDIIPIDFSDGIIEKKQEIKKESYAGKQLNLMSSSDYNLNRDHIFSTFVEGKSNEFAKAAAEAVSKEPGEKFNPLFIYGGVGLGKTHLMHAIGNEVLKSYSEKKVYYCSSEQFMNDMIDSLKNNSMTEFREKYRKLDILLIDDIQFLSGKESTQEEFFHTFNELRQSGKQIVISSDRVPKEIQRIEERLVSRFEQGLIADIKQPDYETRVAILTKKSENDGIDIPKEVLRYTAEIVNSNIRELEGALNRIIARASLMKKEISIELVEEIFQDDVNAKSKLITPEKIITVVSEHYGISIEDMKSTKRPKNIMIARQVAMYLFRNMLNMSLSEIGSMFGGKDHTTVMHSVNKIETRLNEENVFNKEMIRIREKISS